MGPHSAENRSYAESLERLSVALNIQDCVVFLSLGSRHLISDEIVRQLYRLADALLLPSREEGFGIPILEAGLAGIPIFCSDLASLMEIGRSDAIYFAPGADAEAVAEKITTTLSSDPRHSLRKRVIQEYSWDHIYTRHVAPILTELK
jgi:glycosyltransferase involved in cell wall biosynthesis